MGAAIRYVLLGIVLAGFGAQLVEPFAAEIYKRLGLDSAEWVEPVATILENEAAWPAFLVIVGMTVGAWLHWLASKWDRRSDHKSSARQTALTMIQPNLGIKCKALAQRIRESNAPFGRSKGMVRLLSEYDVVRWGLRDLGVNLPVRKDSDDPEVFLRSMVPALEKLHPYLFANRLDDWRAENPHSVRLKRGWLQRLLRRGTEEEKPH